MKKMRYFFALFLFLNVIILTSCSELSDGKSTSSVFVPIVTQIKTVFTTKAPPQITTPLATTKQTTQKTSKVMTAAPATNAPPETAQDDATITVYVTATGTKYHSEGCRYLKDSCIAISLSEAKQKKYEPCSVCNPTR